MANSLLTGLSGLRGHQTMLEVIGNNLANLNTTAYKSSRALFSDLMYELHRGGTSGTPGVVGGTNPMQIGTGSRIAHVDRHFGQGNLEATGQDLDVAIDGGGFLVVSNGTGTYYTRSGALSLDSDGFLVDPATGSYVQRFGTVGESPGSDPSFQAAGDNRINVPIGLALPGNMSTQLDIIGSLGATSTGPVAQALRTSEPFLAGGSPATTGTLLNDLDSNTDDYVAGDEIVITGRDHDDALTITRTLSVDATTTLQEVLDELQVAFPNTTFGLDSQGNLTALANDTGPSTLAVSIEDAPNQTGHTDFATHEFEISALGKDADTVNSTVEVFDERGSRRAVQLQFTKQADGSWNMTADIDAIDGTVVDGLVEGITFNSDGSFAQVTGTGAGDGAITLQFSGIATPQTIPLNFGTFGSTSGLTEISDPSLRSETDGYPPGELERVRIDADGTVYGQGSNGQSFSLAQLAIASFQNTDGLEASGNNHYTASLASGSPEIGTALSGERGAVRSGQLESSNVDIALEFTRLIVAQRGFSANARTISVTDEVLEELTGIIR